MKIAIMDADLIGRKKNRFPNLVCMKLSAYHKEKGDEVTLKTDYEDLDAYDKVYVSKVFTDTPFPNEILERENVEYGGTGFFYDKAKPLSDEIEHHMPDYHLYDDWVNNKIANGEKRKNYEYFLDYSIGFVTRGCFRKCPFCVNQKYDQVMKHSPISEFLDKERKKICLLDDNFFGCPQWREILDELEQTGKPYKFRQGLDERLLTREKCQRLFSCHYDGDFVFAFDNIKDAEVIEKNIKMARE